MSKAFKMFSTSMWQASILERTLCLRMFVPTEEHECPQIIKLLRKLLEGFPGGSVEKNTPVMQKMQETQVWSLGQEDPLEEGRATQCSCLENPMNRGAWWAAVHGVAKSRTGLKQLSTHTWKLLGPASDMRQTLKMACEVMFATSVTGFLFCM